MNRTRCFFLPQAEPDADCLRLEGEEHLHLSRSLRLGPGARVVVVDGRGGRYDAVVDSIDRRGADLSVRRFELTPPPAPVDLALPLIRLPRLEIAVEKGAEIGVRRILPLRSARVRWRGGADREQKMRERIERKLVAAVKQSGRAWLPAVESPVAVADLCRDRSSYESVLVARPDGSDPAATIAGGLATPALCVVGPEGGFDPEEDRSLEDAGCRSVSLGDAVLRAETAAICLLFLAKCAAR